MVGNDHFDVWWRVSPPWLEKLALSRGPEHIWDTPGGVVVVNFPTREKAMHAAQEDYEGLDLGDCHACERGTVVMRDRSPVGINRDRKCFWFVQYFRCLTCGHCDERGYGWYFGEGDERKPV